MVKKVNADGVFVGSTILKLHDNTPELKKNMLKNIKIMVKYTYVLHSDVYKNE
jgi:tryptophan synthase alpha subunit